MREYVNEILTSIFKKQKILEANERSVYQLLELSDKTNSDMPKSYHCNKNLKSLCFGKKFILLYLEDLKLLITRCYWRVTKIYYSYYTFKQARFRSRFVLRNHKSRQNVKNAIKKYLFKLMNNANFGRDCRDNAM